MTPRIVLVAVLVVVVDLVPFSAPNEATTSTTTIEDDRGSPQFGIGLSAAN